MSVHELLSPDNSGPGIDNVLLAQKINKGVELKKECPGMHFLKKQIVERGRLIRTGEYSCAVFIVIHLVFTL